MQMNFTNCLWYLFYKPLQLLLRKRRFRDELRLTQEHLAVAANLSQIRISQLEHDVDKPVSFEEQYRIVRALLKFAAAHELENYLFQAK